MPIDQFTPYLCLQCTSELPQHNRALCQRCGKLRPRSRQDCVSCQQIKPNWHTLTIGMPYTLETRYLIQQLKFANQPQIGKLLAQLFIAKLKRSETIFTRPECLISVPLHKKRLRERGYNQALIIAKELSKQLDIPLLTASDFIRTRHTPAQSQQDKISRKTNVQGAFELTKSLNYQHVALVDDVLTTGQTVQQASLALLNGGIERVDVWCIARA